MARAAALAAARSGRRAGAFSLGPALAVPAALLVAAFLAAPLAVLFRYSLNRYSPREFMIDAVTAENYIRFFTDAYFIGVLATTVQVAAVCTAVSLLFAFPLAYLLARTDSRWKSALVIAVVFPLMVGNVVRAAGWMAVLGNDGIVNHALLGLGLVTQPVRLMYTPFAVHVGIIAVVLPYMILTLQSVIEGIGRDVEEAASNLGAGPITVFRRVLLPLSLPGVIAGSTLVFILCMNAYATPVLLGGPQFKMMAPALYDQFVRTTNWPFGAALAFILMVSTLVLTVIGTTVLSRRMHHRRLEAAPR
ncbi:ABC transporter permease [Elioraea sp. Yellowstone]|uniref:ABC transporter permease n=1 Tax=Elioraea sp. Yellowstone TaxID=2592070 RepID=UPI001150DA04|nr:ABC transporter permease [Elioraea sp. Yellowstone]TQF82773.1 ABC transporter permease [Elioraea sp. Yellowstone]